MSRQCLRPLDGVTRLALLAAIVAAAAPARARDLTVVSWGGAYQEAQRTVYFEPFRLLGYGLADESWAGDLGDIRRRVAAGGDPGWDLVQIEAGALARGCVEGLFRPLDWDAIGGKNRYLRGAVHDCGVGAVVYSLVLAYDGDALPEGPASWADFWDTARFPGRRALPRDTARALEIALLADGVPPADLYAVLATPEGADRAFARLETLKPHLIWWRSGAEAAALLASGTVAMAAAYNPRIASARAIDGQNLRIAWAGNLYAFDFWTVLAASPNGETAMRFLDFAGAPANQARLPEFAAYGVTAVAATGMIPEVLLPDLPNLPEHLEQGVAIDADFWATHGDGLRARFDAWAGT
jgi:putative spermidine/putrescine transport system substrate-binding protein